MSFLIFDNQDGSGDGPYIAWLIGHPDGLVVNSRRWFDRGYLVLHRATCPTIRKASRQAGEDPFTGRAYIKVCADSQNDLLIWVRSHGSLDFSKRCRVCRV